MDLLFKVVKIGALLILILVLAVLVAPSMKGPFVVIHFSTALRGWLLAQLVLVGFAVAAHALCAHLLAVVSTVETFIVTIHSRVVPSTEPMRC
jgi:hypothetical protein